MIKEDFLTKGLSLLVILLSLPTVFLIPSIFFKYMFSLDLDLNTTFLGIWTEVWLHALSGQPTTIATYALSLDIAGCLFLIVSVISFLRNLFTETPNTNNKAMWKDFPSLLLKEPSFFTYRFALVTFLTLCSILINDIFWPSLNFLDQWFIALIFLFGDKYFLRKIVPRLWEHDL